MGGKIPLEKGMATTPVFLSEKFHGQRNLVGYRPCGCKESDTIEQLRLTLFFALGFRWANNKFRLG